MPPARVIHLVAADVSVILVQRAGLLPTVAHWGCRVTADDAALIALVDADVRPGLDGGSDKPYEPSILPEHTHG